MQQLLGLCMRRLPDPAALGPPQAPWEILPTTLCCEVLLKLKYILLTFATFKSSSTGATDQLTPVL